MSHVSYAYGSLLLDVSEERSLVVDEEVEDSVLIGQDEAGAKGSSIVGCACRGEIEAVEGREHREFELQSIALGNGKGNPLVPDVLGQGDVVSLETWSVTAIE